MPDFASELAAHTQSDSTQACVFPLLAGGQMAGAHIAHPAELEREVVALFDAYRVRLLGYVSAIGVDSHDGEEVVQEVFLSLYGHLRQGKPRNNLRGWIFRVAHNLALKQRHATERRMGYIEADDDAESAHDPEPNPEQRLLSQQRQRRLLSVVSALPELDRLCLRLRAEGLRYREIAKVLDISLGSVSLSLTRSLARLTRADEA
jgi:RNA polymerase sigma-70 factor, ECF subfamily